MKKFKALIELGNEFDFSFENYEDIEIYEKMNMNELAEQFVEDGLFGDIPKALINYINYDAIARDLSMDYTEIELTYSYHI
jgi:antirestriction protein